MTEQTICVPNFVDLVDFNEIPAKCYTI